MVVHKDVGIEVGMCYSAVSISLKSIRYNLTTYFSPNKGQSPSLSISYGRDGSKLSHDHTTQFTFVLQSLMLWRDVINNMFRYVAGSLDLCPSPLFALRGGEQGRSTHPGKH